MILLAFLAMLQESGVDADMVVTGAGLGGNAVIMWRVSGQLSRVEALMEFALGVPTKRKYPNGETP